MSSSDGPLLSIITGTRNRPVAFRRLVDSIEEHTDVHWELVISDASDIPIEKEPVATDATWPRIRVLAERPRLGCTAGYNRAFKEAKGRWVVWLNDDVTVTAGWATTAIAFMRDHLPIGLGAFYYDEPERKTPLAVNDGWGIPYANFGILRRDLGEQIGWFDDDLRMYGNDNSLTFKVLMAGLGVAGIPGTVLHHHSVDDIERVENQRGRFQDNEILRRKYFHLIDYMKSIYLRQKELAGL